jgi:hypothetical protein
LQQQKPSKFTNSSRFSENQAELKNVGASQKKWADFQNIGGFPKCFRIYKMLAPAENQAALLFRLG